MGSNYFCYYIDYYSQFGQRDPFLSGFGVLGTGHYALIISFLTATIKVVQAHRVLSCSRPGIGHLHMDAWFLLVKYSL